MIAVSILSVGMVAVLRSFLNSQSLLDAVQKKAAAIRILDARMDEIEESRKKEAALLKEEGAVEEKQAEEAVTEEEIVFGNRMATLKTQISPLGQDMQANGEETDSSFQAVDEVEEIKLTISWQEGGKNKDEVLAAYFEKKN